MQAIRRRRFCRMLTQILRFQAPVSPTGRAPVQGAVGQSVRTGRIAEPNGKRPAPRGRTILSPDRCASRRPAGLPTAELAEFGHRKPQTRMAAASGATVPGRIWPAVLRAPAIRAIRRDTPACCVKPTARNSDHVFSALLRPAHAEFSAPSLSATAKSVPANRRHALPLCFSTC